MPPEPQRLPLISLKSSAFEHGGALPLEYTCDSPVGATAPNVVWEDVPETTKSLVLWVSDLDAENFVHWLIYDMPPEEAGVPVGVSDEPIIGNGGRQGRSGTGRFGYEPPCPPGGQTHNYVFRVYALDAKLGLQPGALSTEVSIAMLGLYVGYGKLTATYARPEN